VIPSEVFSPVWLLTTQRMLAVGTLKGLKLGVGDMIESLSWLLKPGHVRGSTDASWPLSVVAAMALTKASGWYIVSSHEVALIRKSDSPRRDLTGVPEFRTWSMPCSCRRIKATGMLSCLFRPAFGTDRNSVRLDVLAWSALWV
jgi:hypothetical protein